MIILLERARDAGSCPALSLLGDIAWYHRGSEAAESAAKTAEALYSQAASCGDQRASNELYRPEVFEKSDYVALVQALSRDDQEYLDRKARFLTASFIEGLYSQIGQEHPGAHFDPTWSSLHYRGGQTLLGLKASENGNPSSLPESVAYEYALPLVFRFFYPDQGAKALDEVRESFRSAGKAEAIRLINNYQPRSLFPWLVVNGIEHFSSRQKSLLKTIREAMPEIKTISDIRLYLDVRSNRDRS